MKSILKSLLRSFILLFIVGASYIIMNAFGYGDVQSLIFSTWGMGAYLMGYIDKRDKK